jgi:hypothetical protein
MDSTGDILNNGVAVIIPIESASSPVVARGGRAITS